MATAATLHSGSLTVNGGAFVIRHGEATITQEVLNILKSAAGAFQAKSYKIAARHFKTALDLLVAKDDMHETQLVILTKYMLYICGLEFKKAKDLLDSLRNLEELERSHGYKYPMLYYAVGKAYFKLYRFNKAEEIVKKGFSVLNKGVNVEEYNIPGTDIVIPESSRERLVGALVNLNDQCSTWHRPDAVCCMPDCTSYSQNESADKNIFFRSPTFSGTVIVNCNNTSNACMMSFHSACWKIKKDQLCSLGKMSDKEVLNLECFTPNCENQGVRCIVKRILVYGDDAKIKASITQRVDDSVWHAKTNPTLKGAIRKQQQTPKVKVPSSEPRVTPYERPIRPSNSNYASTHSTTAHRTKIEENEEEDDIQDEQALKTSIEKLVELRAKNFGIKDDEIWRPNLPMYGNEYMLVTADLMPDPDFSDEGPERGGKQAFFFSDFHSYLDEKGPVKLEDLNDQWLEVKNMVTDGDDALNHYLDISEFLVQSVKYAIVGNYICVARHLPEAYELAKNDACETLRFLIENDLDQRSTSSSVEDEVVFTDISNGEKNNNSLLYSTVSESSTFISKESSCFSDVSTVIDSKDSVKTINETDDTQETAPGPSQTPEIPKTQTLPEFDGKVQENGLIAASDLVEDRKTVNEKKAVVPSEIMTAKHPEPEVKCNTDIVEPRVKEECDEWSSFIDAINGIDERNFGLIPSKPTFEDMTPIETNHKMNHSGVTANWPTDARDMNFSSSFTGENGAKSSDNKAREQYPSHVAELIEEIRNLTEKLSEYQRKVHNVESELQHFKEAYRSMRVKMLEKSLQGQYGFNYGMLVAKIDECSKNYDICTGIETMLMKSIGQKLPSYGANWLQLKNELKNVSERHQDKFREYNEQLLTTKEPENLEEFALELDTMPDIPQNKLMDVIESAFGIYRMHQMKEFQRIQIIPQPSAPAAPQPQQLLPQHQQMFAPSQYRPSAADFFVGAQLIQNTPGLAYHPSQLNFNRPLTPTNLPLIRNLPHSTQSLPFFAHPPSLSSYQNSAPVQQHVISTVQQTSSELTHQKPSPVQQNVAAAIRENTSPVSANSPTPNFSSAERPRIVPPFPASSSSLSFPRSYTSFIQQNGQSSEHNLSLPPSYAKSSVETENPTHNSEQSIATLPQTATSLEASELPTFSPTPESIKTPMEIRSPCAVQFKYLEQRAANLVENLYQGFSSSTTIGPPTNSTAQEPIVTPVKKKISTSLTRENNFALPATKNSLQAKSVPELTKPFVPPQRASTPEHQNTSVTENKQNFDESKNKQNFDESKNKQNFDESKNYNLQLAKDQNLTVPQSIASTNNQKDWNSLILQSPVSFKDNSKDVTHEDIDARVTETSLSYATCAKSETPLKAVGNTSTKSGTVGSSRAATKETKSCKKIEHSMDKLMRKMREQYKGVLELDLLKGVEWVRKKHNNSLSKLTISRIIREAEKVIVDRQQKQLCGYGKRPPSQYYTQSNAGPWYLPDDEHKRQNSVSSILSGNSLKKEGQNSLSSRKQWEPVATLNDTWKKETPESECAICLETVVNTASYTLQCKHTFHKTCIKSWYQQSQSCPTCRVHSTIDDEYPPLPLG